MSSDMRGEAPAVTEDSDLHSIIKETYRGQISRTYNGSTMCVGGALCHFFLKDEPDWKIINRGGHPFPDSLAYDLEWIIRDYASDDIREHYFGDSWLEDPLDVGDVQDREDELAYILRYYSNAIINANDAADYGDAWVHVDMFLKEFQID